MPIFRRVPAIAFLAVAIPYLLAPVYRFPSPRRFSGAAIWNPYAHLTGSWQRADLHALEDAWSGPTYGTHSYGVLIACLVVPSLVWKPRSTMPAGVRS